jgi:hypothetical protein
METTHPSFPALSGLQTENSRPKSSMNVDPSLLWMELSAKCRLGGQLVKNPISNIAISNNIGGVLWLFALPKVYSADGRRHCYGIITLS